MEFANCQGEGHAEEESSEDEWSDADTDTPIDSIDPFVVFADTVRQLQTSASPRFQVLCFDMCLPCMLSNRLGFDEHVCVEAFDEHVCAEAF